MNLLEKELKEVLDSKEEQLERLQATLRYGAHGELDKRALIEDRRVLLGEIIELRKELSKLVPNPLKGA